MSHGSSSVVLQCIWKLQIHWSMKSFWVEFRGLRYTTAVASTTVWTHLYNFPRPAPPLKIVSPLTIRPTICQNGQLVSLFFSWAQKYMIFFPVIDFLQKTPLHISLYVLKKRAQIHWDSSFSSPCRGLLPIRSVVIRQAPNEMSFPGQRWRRGRNAMADTPLKRKLADPS